jgi:two-component system cell cycle response regulator CtrA
MRILLASATPDRIPLMRALSAQGMLCDLADRFDEVPSILQHSGPYDAAVLDVGRPGAEAHGVLRAIRNRGLKLPAVVICGPLSVEEEVGTLHAGADDVLIRPVRIPVLHGRLQVMLRRCLGHASSRLTCGNVTLDQAEQDVRVNDRQVRLTRREFEVLEMLMLRPGVLLAKEHLMTKLYGGEDGPDQKIVDVFVCKLRRKLAAASAADMIRTVWGRGYVLSEPAPDVVAAARAGLATRTLRRRPRVTSPVPVAAAGIAAAGIAAASTSATGMAATAATAVAA